MGRIVKVILAVMASITVLPAASARITVKDADTIKLEGTTYRLDGIDAPETDQNCLNADGAVYPCGRLAAEELQKYIAGRPIKCGDLRPDPAYPQRRIGQCFVDGIDLHSWLVQHGWAINFEPYAKGRFKTDEDDARRWSVWSMEGLLRGAARFSTMEQTYRQATRFELSCRRTRQAFSR